MRRFLRKILVLCALLLVAAIALDRISTAIFRKGRTVKAQWMHNMKGQHYDLVITGSSRGWWNIDMNAINERCGIRSINLATNHFRPAEILLGLKIFLANGNTTDRLLLEVGYQKASDADEIFSATIYDHLPWLEEDLVFDHLSERDREFKWLRRIPYARYAKYNALWGPEEAIVTLLDKRRTLFDSTGSFFTDREYHGYPYLEIDAIDMSFDPDLAETIEICRREGIAVEAFMAPYYKLRIAPGTNEEFHDMMDIYGIELHDHSQLLDSSIYFDDNWHLGHRGGEAYTNILMEEIICPEK